MIFDGAILHLLIQLLLAVRIVLKPHREPASRISWLVVIVSIPVFGILFYLLLGETNIGRRRRERMRAVLLRLRQLQAVDTVCSQPVEADLPERYAQFFKMGESINGFKPVSGNQACLLNDSNATIDAIVADIDAAKQHVHVMFYIWLPDNNGCKVAAALIRAAERGVVCRAMADDLGSRTMIGSSHWKAMAGAGVNLASALPIGNPLLRPLKGRIDLRNHRKIVVIDSYITYCGSQNCADPEFLIKAKYAPWVDIMMRFEGPVALQNQYLFASDWEAETREDISYLLVSSDDVSSSGCIAQVLGTGPTGRYSAMPEVFETLMYGARRELIITTPYYVPDESMQAGLCACARRGVDTTIVFPRRNDSWIVAAASHSYYAELLAAGVKIFEYAGGLLHAKSVTLDGEVTLIGSANMDRRSFELNFENNILLYDRQLTDVMRERQRSYITCSTEVTMDDIKRWSWRRRLLNNAVAMFGPVL